MASDVISYIYLIGIITTVAGDAAVKVIQYPAELTVIQGENGTFSCETAENQHNSNTELYWWKQGESGFLNTKPDNRKTFESKSFHLLNVNFQDSGVYLCAVMRQEKIAGKGTGSCLTVHVPPTPLKIFPRASERDPSKSLTLVCETAEVYPGDVTFIWNKDGNEVKTGINFMKKNNSNGLYKVSSSMEEPKPVQSGVIYTCLAFHVSLQTPAVAVYNTAKSKGSGSQHRNFLIGGCAGGGLAFLLLLIVIGKRCQLNKRKGSHRNQNRLNHCEEQTKHGKENEPVAYVTLNLTSSKKTPRPKRQEERTVYAQTLQGAEKESVTYAKMDLNRCKKTPRPKKQDENTVYTQTKQRVAVNNLT
ncbi:signal-regulatory protein beta-1-like [Callorhinchus milii]|uniref:signal-regulatory protein beta-1-like n=1 Tax=Callorhinchus milii TaxID=7868 RepID=UPI001C3FEA97|nr:signal-regulatory protein beta-1-like [Callorhinchus milii]